MFPAKVRDALYSIGAINTAVTLPVFGYLVEQEKLSVFWLGLVSVVNAGIFILAKANVTPDEE
jgi:hypothetical protein